MSNLNNLNDIDLLTEWLGRKVYDELDALIDQIYEDQQQGLNPDLDELILANQMFRTLWQRNLKLEVVHKDNEVRIRNHEVILLALTALFGASLTIEGIKF